MDALEKRIAAIESRIRRQQITIIVFALATCVMAVSIIVFRTQLAGTYELVIQYIDEVSRALNGLLQAT